MRNRDGHRTLCRMPGWPRLDGPIGAADSVMRISASLARDALEDGLDSPKILCEGGTLQQAGVCKARKKTGACAGSSECASGYFCDKTGQCAQHKAAGDPCTVGAKECGPFSYCNAGKCADKLAAINEPCGMVSGESVPCGEGYCDATVAMPAGVCRAQKKAGDACTTTTYLLSLIHI